MAAAEEETLTISDLGELRVQVDLERRTAIITMLEAARWDKVAEETWRRWRRRYYGGGGGPKHAGGGGSSYIGGVTSGATTAAANNGDGTVKICFRCPSGKFSGTSGTQPCTTWTTCSVGKFMVAEEHNPVIVFAKIGRIAMQATK